ncbi:enoyl-CoA hydratase-related protein [Dactylosporangium sp. NPDC000555]|uniref:enoyl-CoA hydratase-related protein n=1 Tax=Dactylosporangium sp. NPDC000555 TaxID=3154260 RepID=UPI0033200324
MTDVPAFEDVLYEVEDGLAWITINRPDRYNAFRGRTVDELIDAFSLAWSDPQVGVVALTGAGDKAFCAGGDQKQKAETGDYGPTRSGRFEMVRLQRMIRELPKPVIAAVNGIAVGGGHVLHVVCDMTIAADTARFGQSGPKVGSFDGGLGAGLLIRTIGEKRAREMWMHCRLYDAETVERWGLVNTVVPAAELRSAVRAAADDLMLRSPTAIKLIKHCLNADVEGLPVNLAFDALDLLKQSEESHEGASAFAEKRSPDFARFR